MDIAESVIPVMEQLDSARDELLDEGDQLVGRVRDVQAVEKRVRHRLRATKRLAIGAFL